MLQQASRWRRRIVNVGACGILVAAVAISGCEKGNGYSQKTPEDVIATANLMVKTGDVKQLPKLIYADNKDMRAVLNRLGSLCGNVNQLATSLAEKFPNDVAKLKEDAKQAAAEGRSSSLLGQLMSQANPGGGNKRKRAQDFNPDQMKGQREEFQGNITRVFADPFSFLAEAQGRLSTVPIDNDTAGILFDGKPVLPPLGMTMRKGKDDLWYIVLPTNIPGAGNFLPQNHDEYSILGSLIKVADNAVIDLRRDVETGSMKDLEEVSRRAGEKAFLPMVLTFYAYSHAIEVRNEATKNATAQAAAAKAAASSATPDPSAAAAPPAK